MKPDDGVICALLENFAKRLYPRAQALEERMQRGERMSLEDLDHVAGVLSEIAGMRSLIARHPEHAELASRVISLYAGITRRAWENEPNKPTAPRLP
jgi:hypothetical protein